MKRRMIVTGMACAFALLSAEMVHAELYRDANGVWRQRGSMSNAAVSSAWKEPKTSEEAFAKYLGAKTAKEKSESWGLYQQLQEEEQKVREKGYEADRKQREAEHQRRMTEIDRESEERNIEHELKWDRKLRNLRRNQPTELRFRLKKRGYSEEAVNNVVGR